MLRYSHITVVLLMHMIDWMPHMQSLVVLMAEDSNQEVLVTCWQALAAVAGSIPKEMMPSYVRTLKEAVSTAREKERRKRRPLPLRVAGFCLPKALQPLLPIFLQGVLQVHPSVLCASASLSALCLFIHVLCCDCLHRSAMWCFASITTKVCIICVPVRHQVVGLPDDRDLSSWF